MNKYPLWKNVLVLGIVLAGLLYSLPNFYGSTPAVQVSATRTVKVDSSTLDRIESALKRANVEHQGVSLTENTVQAKFADPEVQLRARDVIARELGENYVVALNLMPAAPAWTRWFGAKPMSLGLDLQGGVYFLMQVDTNAVIKKSQETAAEDFRRLLRENKLRYLTVTRLDSGAVEARFRDATERDRATALLKKELREFEYQESQVGQDHVVVGRLTLAALTEKKKFAIEQNITALNNRVNELGVSEPVIQRQGEDRIAVQLPGVQDTAKAKDIIGRTATLEIKLVNEDAGVSADVPPGSKLYKMRDGRPIVLKNALVYSGDNIVDAMPGFDNQTGRSIVSITLDGKGAAINQRVTGENINKRMAVVYIELRSEPKMDEAGRPVLDAEGRPVRVSKRIEEVITAPVIRSQLGKRFQIEGLDSPQEASELSLLLRAGALAAPVEIVEERTVGPSLGKENIERGFHSTWVGFALIAVFMIAYYVVFGLTSVLALAVNVLLLVGLLSLLPTTLTLPGMAGIALTIGMAIDANVLINERIREEIRNGNSPHASIRAGYERAFGTIIDSNITTLIAGIALFAFGSGAVRGFAVVLCLGIVTSMFSGVVVSRALVNFVYGRNPKLERLAIGNTRWNRLDEANATATPGSTK